MSTASTCDVLIVGAGPVGLTLAAALSRAGVALRIVDGNAAPTDKSKALVVWSRTLELLADLGLADEFLASGMLAEAASIYGGDKRLAHVPLHVEGTRFDRPLMIPQSETERLLTGHLARNGVVVERNARLVEFTDAADRVEAHLERADGSHETLACPWLVGCDGAHSIVRKTAGLAFEGTAEPNNWLLADVHIEGPVAPAEIAVHWHSLGVAILFPMGGGRFRVVVDTGPAEGAAHPPDPTLEQMQRVVDERISPEVRLFDPIWLAGFRIHERKVAEYRRGRVFLAGDAAHIHSPAGGQGMNTGMQDAFNLAWKLALVVGGRGRAEPLFGSYTAERGAVGDQVLAQAGRLTTVATLHNPVSRFARNRLIAALATLPAFRRTAARTLSELDIHYPHGPLGAESWSGHGPLKPGDRVPDLTLGDPATGADLSLLGLLDGGHHHLLLFPSGPDIDGPRAVWRQVEELYPGLIRTHVIVRGDVPSPLPTGGLSCVQDAHGASSALIGDAESAVLLVRPDGYLGFRGRPMGAGHFLSHLASYLIPATS